MPTFLTALLAGTVLGLSGGLSPGPLLALVATETLRHGIQAGVRVALAPLLTDAPIILAAMWLLRPLTDQRLPLALINFGGGLYLAWLGIQSLRFQGAELPATTPADALRRGVIANFLNPSPYLFWLAVVHQPCWTRYTAVARSSSFYRRLLHAAGRFQGAAGNHLGSHPAFSAQW
ncbi:MAG: LysE family transporter [Candidatus Competibacteraceae bacterium]